MIESKECIVCAVMMIFNTFGGTCIRFAEALSND